MTVQSLFHAFISKNKNTILYPEYGISMICAVEHLYVRFGRKTRLCGNVSGLW